MTTIEFTSGPDARGRRSFTLRWQKGRDRGQCFFACPWSYIRRMRRAGQRVIPQRLAVKLGLLNDRGYPR